MSLLASELQKSFLHFLLASGWLIGPVSMLPPTRVGHPTLIGNCYHGLLAKHLHVSPDSFLHTARTSTPQARQFTLGPYQGCLTSNLSSSLFWPLRDTTLLSAQAGNKQESKGSFVFNLVLWQHHLRKRNFLCERMSVQNSVMKEHNEASFPYQTASRVTPNSYWPSSIPPSSWTHRVREHQVQHWNLMIQGIVHFMLWYFLKVWVLFCCVGWSQIPRLMWSSRGLELWACVTRPRLCRL